MRRDFVGVILILSVSGQNWGQAPRMQVALSGVFGLQSRRRQRRQRKHKKALAAFCKEQPQETRTIKIEGRLRRSTYANSQTQTIELYDFESDLAVVEKPMLTESP